MWKRNPTYAEKAIIKQLEPNLNIKNWCIVAQSTNTITLQHKKYSRLYKNLQLKEEVV
ncbi:MULTISPECIES: hypothetical protein [Lysinibacillus]|uniref:hypothetical protein n=1 Tax=Lysinibacillus TaxID=400634 RepID=UPI0028967791|nr:MULTISPECIES: hypothetical protein [Lysinibacillus]MED3799980.1 hypothetical protein [Lysinibacillus capsici]